MNIYKYELKVKDTQFITANVIEFLSVQVQNGQVNLWVLVDGPPRGSTPSYMIKMFTTGNYILDQDLDNHKFLDTFQLHDGNFVGHVFVPKL